MVATGVRPDAGSMAALAAVASVAPVFTSVDDDAADVDGVVSKVGDLPPCIFAANAVYFNTLLSLLEGAWAQCPLLLRPCLQ